MTISIAVRVGTAVVFATDSKITTSGISGRDAEGNPVYARQTYDNAYKIAIDPSKTVMAMVAGDPQLHGMSAVEFVAKHHVARSSPADAMADKIFKMLTTISGLRQDHWNQSTLEEKDWSNMTMLLAVNCPRPSAPQTWVVNFAGSQCSAQPILVEPGLWMEGWYSDAYRLLYGLEYDLLEEVRKELQVDSPQFRAAVWQAMARAIPPIRKINFLSMPVIDAVHFAYFMAQVQVQMCKYLPDTPACGGPIDIAVLETLPVPKITMHEGKTIHHPAGTGQPQ